MTIIWLRVLWVAYTLIIIGCVIGWLSRADAKTLERRWNEWSNLRKTNGFVFWLFAIGSIAASTFLGAILATITHLMVR